MPASDVLVLRLLPDAATLQWLPKPRENAPPPPELYARLCAECDRVGIPAPPVSYFETLVEAAAPGNWLNVMSGLAVQPPVDGRVELLVDLPVAPVGSLPRLHRMLVREGTPLARKVRGEVGTAGLDTVGATVAPRPPKEPTLPAGLHTKVSEDGTTLLAACDGEAVFRHFRIDVHPSLIFEGDVGPREVVRSSTLPIVVTGSVAEGARIEAYGDIFVQGNVVEANLQSYTACVTVAGVLSGSTSRRARVRAATSIIVDQARLADLSTKGSVQILRKAWQSTISATGDLVLADTIENSLHHVELDIHGLIRPRLEPVADSSYNDRRYSRVPCSIAALYARHVSGAPEFLPCRVNDLSPAGARFRVDADDRIPEPGEYMQLRFMLPGSKSPVHIIGSPIWAESGVIGVTFLQCTRQDHDRIGAYCRQQMAKNPSIRLGSSALRANN
jgi:hypothetical protein